ncbi:hypothetical protein VTN49DRAFT_2678 [Thermomyces lanuginosus]|uniref:uncharacterized protein n=1 Tax=Thermomyces lanuginosus TaxID=5541 RepID=UPI0037449E94
MENQPPRRDIPHSKQTQQLALKLACGPNSIASKVSNSSSRIEFPPQRTRRGINATFLEAISKSIIECRNQADLTRSRPIIDAISMPSLCGIETCQYTPRHGLPAVTARCN